MLLDHFGQVRIQEVPLSDYLQGVTSVPDLETLKEVLDYVHMSRGLLRYYGPEYPLIEPRELLPSFEENLLEFHHLPGYSLLALDRPLDYQAEPFQFDLLQVDGSGTSTSGADPNARAVKARLPKELHLDFEMWLAGEDLTSIPNYPVLLDYIFHMDRGHILARDAHGQFRTLGLFASFPSNLDTEIKSFGRRIGKFKPRDNESYQQNRIMVYQFLMELYGFPISSERRTSAALFARDLTRHRERFLIKVQSQSDRMITTLYHPDPKAPYPTVEKVALISLPGVPQETMRRLEREGYFVDPSRLVVLLRAVYQQHRYNKLNVMEERAMSLEHQEIIHPRTGERLPWLNVLQTREDRLLMLNDIVRGEHPGQIVYQGHEVVHGTADQENRLKFLSAWMTKHQRRFIAASPAFLEKMEAILESYLLNPEMKEVFKSHRFLHKNIVGQMAYIRQANIVHRLERMVLGRSRVKYLDLIQRLIDFLNEHETDIPTFYEPVFEKLLFLCDKILNDPYLNSHYLEGGRSKTAYAQTIRESMKTLTELKAQLEKEYAEVHGMVQGRRNRRENLQSQSSSTT